VKTALKAVLKEQYVTEAVLRTTLIEVEAIVNSRPLTYNSSDPKDFTALTPSHFLLGHPDEVGPMGEFNPNEINSRKRWRQVQVIVDHLWKRWLKEYLPSLTLRSKWTQVQRNHMSGDLVLLADENLPRGQWQLGRIVDVKTSSDGNVRTVSVKTLSGTYVRPANKVCLLEEAITTYGVEDGRGPQGGAVNNTALKQHPCSFKVSKCVFVTANMCIS
jgi:hypothetical protein